MSESTATYLHEAQLLDTWAQGAADGDEGAFEQLVNALQNDLRTWIAWHLGDPLLTEEVLQETFVAVFENLANYEPRGHLRTWIKTIARHRCQRAIRSRQFQRQRTVSLQSLLLAENARLLEAEEADPNSNAEDEVARLLRCLDRLPAHAQNLLRQRYTSDRSLSLLAASLNRSEQSLANTLHRIRKKLRVCIAQLTVSHP